MVNPGAEISKARSSMGVAAPHSEAINLWKGELLSKEATTSVRETLLALGGFFGLVLVLVFCLVDFVVVVSSIYNFIYI